MIRLRVFVVAALCLGLFTAAAPAQDGPARRRAFRSPPEPFTRHTVHVPGPRPADLAVVVLPADDPQNAKGTLVLLHGYRLRKEIFYGYDRLRRDHGWNLVLPDFRGHGESSKAPVLLGVDETRDVKAVLDLCDELELGGPRAVFGISMGASVGLLTAAEDSRIRGVFAVSPYENAYDSVGQFSAAVSGLDLSKTLIPPEQAEPLRRTDVREALKKRDDLRIRVVVGSEDCFPPAMQERILAASASPERLKSMFVGEGFTHFNIVSWPEVTPLLLEFLENVRSDAAAGPAEPPATRPVLPPTPPGPPDKAPRIDPATTRRAA